MPKDGGTTEEDLFAALFDTEGLVGETNKTETTKNMKNFLLLLVTALVVTAVANASIVPCSNYFPGSPQSLSSNANFNGAGNGCSISGVAFSNFSWENESAGSPGPVFLVNVSQTGAVINLQFNPNMGAGQDIHVLFNVTGAGVLGMDLANNTGPSSIDEVNYGGANCTVNIAGTPTNCTLLVNTGGINGPNGFFPGPTSSNEFFYTQATGNNIWVFKDISTAFSNGVNSGFVESFVIPEPMTLSLLGSALIGLGLLRLRQKKH